MSRSATLLPILATLVLSSPALARDDGAPARALGMGEAVRALGYGTAGLYYNPACMSQGMQYSIDLGYGYRSWANGHNAHISLVDSKTNPDLAGGVSYTYFYGTKGGWNVQKHDIRIATSSAYVGKGFNIAYGGGFRYLKLSGDEDDKFLGFDLGLLFGISDIVYIGVSGQNLYWNKSPKEKSDGDDIVTPGGGVTGSAGLPFAPRTVGFGLGIVYSILHLGVDVILDLESKGPVTAMPAVGLELTLGQAFALRAGFMWDRVGDGRQDQKRITAGLGYVSEYVGVDVGYGHDVSHAENWLVETNIRVFLP